MHCCIASYDHVLVQGFIGSALILLLLYYTENRTLALLLLSGFMSMQAANFPGVQVNVLDVAPNFSGTIFSFATFLSSVLGIFGLFGASYLVTDSVCTGAVLSVTLF